jgi:cobalamin transport system substrate-binding protein
MRRRTVLLTTMIVALAVSACGSGTDAGSSGGSGTTSGGPSGAAATSGGDGATAATFPVTVTGTNGDLTIDARPERIVSLSPSATEMLFAIGAGDHVVAVDDQSNYPAEAPRTKLSGYEPNVEAIAGYGPDLVVYATEPGDLGPSLQGLGVPALQLDAPAELADVYAQVETLGAATGHPEEASTVADGMRSDIDAIVASADPSAGLSFYYELDDTYYSVTSKTFIGQLFEQLGLVNIADAAEHASSGYPQLSAEYIVDADPDLVFLADTRCCAQTAASVAERPGWSDLAAVRDGDVVELDDDVASRWGPRLVDLMRQIADAAEHAQAQAA